MRDEGLGSRRNDLRMPAPPTLAAEAPVDGVPALGAALKARSGEVLERTVAQTITSGEQVDPPVQERFERICTNSTIAVARWIAGDGLEVTRDAARETSKIFGELAAHRAASLNEVARRCLCWRNVMVEVLRESAIDLEASAEALA